MAKSKISRILIVGTGSIANKHHKIAKSLFPEADICAYSESGNRLDDLAMLAGYEEIERFNPDVAVIANTSNRHLEVGIMLAKMGINLLIEKPLSSDFKKVKTLRRIALEKRITIHVGYNLKFLPSLIYLRGLLDEKVIGELVSIRSVVGQNLADWRTGRNYQTTASARKEKGGGVLNELSHEIDYLTWLLGQPSSVFCISQQTGFLEINCEDLAHLILIYSEPKRRYLLVSLDMDMIRKDPNRSCTFIGEQGTLFWDVNQGKISSYNSLKLSWEVVFESSEKMEDTYVSEWKWFSTAVVLGESSLASFDSAVETMRIIRLARISNFFRIPIWKSKSTKKACRK